MKFENNWKHKTLENLEKNIWPSLNPDEHSYLVNTCNSLHKKQLKDFTIEDLRIMIGQSIGLKYLIPMAIDILKSNILAEGHFYEGDLLKSVLTSDKKYWKDERENWEIICNLFEQNRKTLDEHETTWEIRKGWMDSFKDFKQITKL
jgi:hypothetical protein